MRDAVAFLAAATTRLAINVTRSARARRETNIGTWLPEQVDIEADLAHSAERAEALDRAGLALLENLSPIERAAYVLREAFDYLYWQISKVLAISEAHASLAEAPARDAYEIGDAMPITAEWRRDSRTLSAGPAILQRRAAIERYACQFPRSILMTSERHHRGHHGTFGNDRFGVLAERFARGFGTPHFIIGQTVIVALWIAANALAFGLHWDPYPFILLNLAFSTQAAYAAPLILLAQTRQAERDKIRDTAVQEHCDAQVQQREAFEFQLGRMLDGDRKREAAHQALLDRQSTLIDEVACALHDVQAPRTRQD